MGHQLYEREHELDTIRQRLADLSTGTGSVIVIEGHAGTGKTALLAAGLADAHAGSHEVLTVRVKEHERSMPGATLRRLGVTSEPEALWRDLVRRTHAAPVVVVVDDLHLADRESIAALVDVADRIEDLALLMMVCVRPGEWPTDEAGLDRISGSATAAVLRLAPLSPLGVRRVLEDHRGSMPTDETVVVQAAWTAGIPFLVTAVAREPGAPGAIPAMVTAAVGRELRRLPAPEAALARSLSILGPGAPLRHVARLAELERPVAERAADRLAGSGLIAPADPLRFRAPIEGAAIAGALEPFARAEAHRRAVAVLADETTDVLQIADHLLLTSAAGDPQVVTALRAAADRAIRDGHPDHAARYLERALDEPPPADERDTTVLDLVNAGVLCGQLMSLERVERILHDLADGPSRAQGLRQLATLQFLGNEPVRAAATLRRGLEHAGDDETLRQGLLADYFAAARFAPQLRADALTRFGEVMQAIATGGALPTEPGMLVQVASAMATSGAPRSAVLPIVEELLRTNPTWSGAPIGLFADWICAACVSMDELVLAEQVARRSHVAACGTGDVVRQSFTSYWLGIALLHQGRLDDAVTRFEASLGRQNAIWTPALPWTTAALCVTQLERGRLADAEGALRAGKDALDADPDGLHLGVVLEARGHLAMAIGEPATALRHYEAAGRHLAESFLIDAPTLITWRSDVAFALRAHGADLGRAQALAEHELAQARAMGAARPQARALRAAAAARIEATEAVGLLREAHSITVAAGPRLEHLHVLIDLGVALIAGGSTTAARQPLREALEVSEACGAQAVAGRARTLLRATGTRPRRTARTGIGALTARELKVATLAACGRSNRSIAETLTLSERTVEAHLYNSFGKLGIHRREQLASQLPQNTTHS